MTFVINDYGLREQYVDQGGYFAPDWTGAGTTAVNGPNGRRLAYEDRGNYFSPVAVTTASPTDERFINRWGFVERLSDLGGELYARVFSDTPGANPRLVIDPNGLKLWFSDLGDGTYGLLVNGVEADSFVQNEYNLKVGIDEETGIFIYPITLTPTIIAQNILTQDPDVNAVNPDFINGDHVAQLSTSDGGTPTFTLAPANTGLAIGDVFVGDQYEGPGTMKGIVIADINLIDFDLDFVDVTISAATYPDRTVRIPLELLGGDLLLLLGALYPKTYASFAP